MPACQALPGIGTSPSQRRGAHHVQPIQGFHCVPVSLWFKYPNTRHPEAPASLASLQDAGFRPATLTNSTLEVTEAQLGPTPGWPAISNEVSPSMQCSGSSLPPKFYRYATAELGVGTGDMRLIAACDRDVAGAMGAGGAALWLPAPGWSSARSRRAPTLSARTWSRLQAGSWTRKARDHGSRVEREAQSGPPEPLLPGPSRGDLPRAGSCVTIGPHPS